MINPEITIILHNYLAYIRKYAICYLENTGVARDLNNKKMLSICGENTLTISESVTWS